MKEWCAVAKLGRRCGDDICRLGETLCGFTEEDYDDVVLTVDEDPFSLDEEMDEAGQ